MNKREERIEEIKEQIRGAKIPVIDARITGEESLFEEVIKGDDLTLKDVEKVVKAVVNYSAAAHGVGSETAAEAMQKDPELDAVEIQFSLGPVGNYNGHVAKSTEYKSFGKEGVSYGTNRAKIEFAPGRIGTPLNAEVAATKALFSGIFNTPE